MPKPQKFSIRTKTILYISLLLTMIISIVFFALRYYAFASSLKLEYENAELQMKRIENAFSFELDSMNSSVRDWSQWDETYQYMEGTNPSYVAENLYYDAFEILNFDFILIYDASGNVNYSRQFDFDSETESLVSEEINNAIGSLGIAENSNSENRYSGIVTTSEGNLLIASSAIMPSIPAGETVIGNMVFGRFLDQTEIEYLQSIVELSFVLKPNDGIHELEPLTIAETEDNQILIHQLIDDLEGNHDVMIEVIVPKNISEIVENNFFLMILTIMIATFVLSTVVLIILDKQVFLKLTRLTDGIKNISENSNFSGRLVTNNQDNEISYVSKEINIMLEKLETADQEITKLAYLDHLTGAANRLRFYQLLQTEIDSPTINQTKLAVLFLDLDGFKKINDLYGHDIGDQVLIQVTRRLASTLNPADILARAGGDEYLVLFHFEELIECRVLCNALIHSLAEEIVIHNLSLSITTSIGIALYPEDGIDKDNLIKNADIAMYKAKEEGKNTYRFFSQIEDSKR